MTGSLVEQLQTDEIQRSTPVTDLLRKAKFVAAKLGDSELSAWADHELNGYFDIRTEDLPQYRQLRGEIKWLNPYKGWQSLGLDVTLPCVHPIGEILGLINNEAGFITASVPSEFPDFIRRELKFHADVKFHASCAALSGVIEGCSKCRSRLDTETRASRRSRGRSSLFAHRNTASTSRSHQHRQHW